MTTYKQLVVWQKSFKLVKDIYLVTQTFPSLEAYGLTSQMRRAALSIPTNIAEGSHRGTRKEYSYFVQIAYGSAAELDTQLQLAYELKYCTEKKYLELQGVLIEVQKMLHTLLIKLKGKVRG